MNDIIELNENTNLFGDEIFAPAKIDRTALTNIIYSYMKDLTLSEFVGYLTNHYIEAVEYAGLCQGEKTCQKTSLLFNPQRLSTRAKGNKLSLFEAIHKKSFVNGLARVTLMNKGSVKELLYLSMQIGINGVQYINDFPPYQARNFAKKF